jgi:LPXTG-motif cell wall-anchored protein
MKKFMKASLSFAIAGMMALSMFTAGTKTTANAEDTAASTWTVSKSKTATALDTNNQTQVTLSLPAKEEKLSSDVLFVMDVSSCEKDAETVTENILSELNDQITKNGALVKIGFVVFKGNAMVAYPLTDYKTVNAKDIASVVAKKITDAEADGTFYNQRTNMSSGLACAEEVLNADTEVANSRKHMLLVSDGATYLFCKDSTTSVSGYDYTTAETRVMDWKGTNLANYQDGTLSEWNVKYETKEEVASKLSYAQWAPSNWTDYLATIGEADTSENMAQYDVDYFAALAKNTMHDLIMPSSDSKNSSYNPITNVEESFYQANAVYQQMKATGIDCHAYTTIAEGSKGVAPVFTDFMNYLAGGKADNILSVGNEIFYMLSAGSSIYDEMGTGTDYAFSFVNDPAQLKLTVDGTAYTAKNVAATNGETAVYEFRSAANEETAPYVVHYYAAAGDVKEHIVWDINTNVTELARVQLTYAEKLTTVPTTAGDHTLNTNGTTTLNPVDSNSVEGAPEGFTSPTVTYTVADVVTPKTPATTAPTAAATTAPTAATTDEVITPKTNDSKTNDRPATPNTGDQTNAVVFGSIFAVAIVSLGVVIFFKKKYSR